MRKRRFSRIRLYIGCSAIIVSGLYFFMSFKPKEMNQINTMGSITEQKIDSLIALMTLEEKIGQMTQVRHFDDINEDDIQNRFIGSVIHTEGPAPGETAEEWQAKFTKLQEKALSTRLGIPLIFGVDAVHGQNTFEGATIFPHNIGMGAAANEELVVKAASITALESQATGFNWVFSPCVAIPFNEKWGRVYEAFSESTELTSRLTRASIRGHQGDLSDPGTVLATAKHFIGDGATDFGAEGGTTSLSIEEVHERLMPPYQAAVEENVGAIMASFNTVEGKFMHAHKALITDTLKDAMGFDGIMVSDWKGYSRFGENNIINAGIDMVMAVDGDLDDYQKELKEAVRNGDIEEERINDAVRRILRQKFRLGLFDHPYPNTELIKKIGSKQHREVARQAVRESLVLLKNNDNILPLKKSSKLVVVGEFADNTGLQSGGWTVNWQGTQENYKGATSILSGLKNYSESEIAYDPDGKGKVKDADVAIVVIGENPYAEFFGDVDGEMDLFQLTLSREHQKYVDNYAKQGIPTVVILISGRPLVTTKQIEQSTAFVAAWLPGSEGHGIAEVLYGDYDFKGKLPHSWPESVENYKDKYGPNFWDNSIKPLYPLGYGLTYN